MDVAYVNPFINSTVETFKTMMKVAATAGKPYIKKSGKPTFDVSGIIGLSGQAQGAISLSFPKAVALKVVSAMLGTEIKIVGPELTDGIGEVANIIAGYAKQNLTQYGLTISLPNVVVGQNHTIASPSGIAAIVVPFTSDIGEFVMEVSLKTP